MDCVSCHTSTAALRVSAQSSTGADAYRTSDGKVPAYAAPAVPSLENVHALSYLGSELGINQRTANESHSVTVAVNALLAKP
jgi:predicted subunit of tRNA(5-methylaminomethyl-2-thiouridylate) methyltransferase